MSSQASIMMDHGGPARATFDPLIIVKKRELYGRSLFYPENEQANNLLKLMGRKTFKKKELELLIDLGFNVILQTDTL